MSVAPEVSGPQATSVAAIKISGPQAVSVASEVSGPHAMSVAAKVSGPQAPSVIAAKVSGPQATSVAAKVLDPQAMSVAAKVSGPQATSVASEVSGPQAASVAAKVSGPQAELAESELLAVHIAPDTVDTSGSQVYKCTVGEAAVTNLRGVGQPQDVLAHIDAADPAVVLSPDESQAVEPTAQKLSVDYVEELDTAVPHSRSMGVDPSARCHTCPYTSPEMDWDECCYLVPHAASPMKLCHSDDPEDPQISYSLESVSWPSEISFSHALSSGLDRHGSSLKFWKPRSVRLEGTMVEMSVSCKRKG